VEAITIIFLKVESFCFSVVSLISSFITRRHSMNLVRRRPKNFGRCVDICSKYLQLSIKFNKKINY
jgi:hypothetical protein